MNVIGKRTALLAAAMLGALLGNARADAPKGKPGTPGPQPPPATVQYRESALEFLTAVQLSDGTILGPGTYQLRIVLSGHGQTAKLEFWQKGKLVGKQDGEAHGFPAAPAGRAFSFLGAGFGPDSRPSLTPGPGVLVLQFQSSNSPAFFKAQLKLAPAGK